MFAAIMRPRRGGKTYSAVKFLQANEHSAMLVSNLAMKNIIVKEYQLDEKTAARVITPTQTDKLKGTLGPLVIDNLDMMLSQLLGDNGFRRDILFTATGVSL